MTAVAVAQGQEIEQRRVGGQRALRAKVFLGFHQAESKQAGPDAVCHHARSHRIVRTGQPSRHAQAAGRRILGQGSKLDGHAGRNDFGLVKEIATVHHLCNAALLALKIAHDGHGGDAGSDVLCLVRSGLQVLLDGGDFWRVIRLDLISFAGLGVFLARLGQLLLQGLQLLLRLFLRRLLLRCGQGQQRRIGREVGILALVEQPVEAVVIDLGDRVVLVRVALGAAYGEAHPHLHGGVHAILYSRHAELFVVGAAFIIRHRVAMEGGGDDLVLGGIGKQIAGELFGGELVERHVVVQGLDDPIAIKPDVAAQILLIAPGVCVTGEIQPEPRPVFAEVFGTQQSIDIGFEGRSRERVGLFWRGRQACEVQRETARQGLPVGAR